MNKPLPVGAFSDDIFKFYFSIKNFKFVVSKKEDPITKEIDHAILTGFPAPNGGGRAFDALSQGGLVGEELNEIDCKSSSCTCSNKISSAPQVGLALILNQYCNLKCSYCLDGAKTYETGNFPRMSYETARRSIDLFDKGMSPEAKLNVNLFGGEPLLTFPICVKITNYLKNLRRPKSISIQTNLSFLPNGFIEWALENNVIVISNIDGSREVHDKIRPHKRLFNGSYDATVNSISNIKKAGIPFHLRATVTSLNLHQLSEIEDIHKSLGALTSRLSPLRPLNSDGDSFYQLAPSYEQLAPQFLRLVIKGEQNGKRLLNDVVWRMRWMRRNNTYCGSDDLTGYTISASGGIYSCAWFVGNSDLRLGNVNLCTSIDELDATNVIFRQNPDSDKICRDCSYFLACGGGCSVTRVLSNKETDIAAARQQQCAKTIPIVQYLIRRDFYSGLKYQEIRN